MDETSVKTIRVKTTEWAPRGQRPLAPFGLAPVGLHQPEALRKRAIAFARDEVPRAKDMDDDARRAALDRTMRQAEECKVRSEQGVVMLLRAVLLRWEKIFVLPQVRRLLSDTRRAEAARIEAVIAVL